MQQAVDDLWRYTDELFHLTKADREMIGQGIGVDVSQLKKTYYDTVTELLQEATLTVPEQEYFQKGGKEGIHSEHMGYLLTELQYMQRSYPNMNW